MMTIIINISESFFEPVVAADVLEAVIMAIYVEINAVLLKEIYEESGQDGVGRDKKMLFNFLCGIIF